jgi:hypothetical protein
MPRFKATLISLLCTKPEEDEFWSNGDELRLVVLVDGVERHSQAQDGVGVGTLIPIGRTFDFESSLQVRVTDIDGPIDPDDQLGTVTIPAVLAPAGSQRFTGHGADYLLSYSVIGVPVDLPPVDVPPINVPPVDVPGGGGAADILALARAEAARLVAEARAHRDAAEAARAETERLLAAARATPGAGGADLSGVVGALGGLVGVGGGIIGALGALNASLSSISGALQALPTAVPQVPAQSVGTSIV